MLLRVLGRQTLGLAQPVFRFKGQMELYLRWLHRHERKDDEDPPIGLILCAGKRQETIELLDLDSSGIKGSSYWTEALPRDLCEGGGVRDGARQLPDARTGVFDPLRMLQLDLPAVVYGHGPKC
jgi:hypothetical protein